MKVNTKVLALMTALAAGVAAAQTAPTANTTSTPSGTEIQNVATANFTDPSTGTAATPVSSNTVTTTVLPQPSFDIVYGSAKTDGSGVTTNPANSVSATTPDQAVGMPNQAVTDTYYVVNNGNTPLSVNLSSLSSGSPTSVTYTWTDANGTHTDVASGTVELPVGGVIEITQTTTVPATATPGSLLGATPVGSVTSTTTNGIPSGTTLYENQTVSGTTISGPAQNTDLQYQAITVYDPKLTNNPDGSTDGGTSTTITTTVTPPGTTTAVPGYDATTPSGGATSPGTTPIAISGDKQIAYPPADANTTPDTVVFTNTLYNGGTADDTITLAPDGTGWTQTGVGTWTNTNGVTVQFIDPATGLPADTITVPAGTSANYLTQVTYPDSNSVTNPTPIDIVVKATSGNNPNVFDLTTDTIMPPASSFGDTAAVTQTSGVVESPTTAYYPGSSTTTATTAPSAVASYPMSVSNTGTYPDAFNLSGAVPILLTDGNTAIVPIVYTGATLSPLFTGDATAPLGTTQLPGTAPVDINGTTYYAPIYTTPEVAPSYTGGTPVAVTATVTVPADAAMTTGTTGSNPEPTLQQTASSVYSATNGGSLVMYDTNDPLAIAPVGNVVVAKFTQDSATPAATANSMYVDQTSKTCTTGAPSATDTTQIGNPAGYTCQNTSYLPSATYSYQIIGKNTYNTSIAGFVLTDDLTGKPFNLAAGDVTGSCSVGNFSYDPATHIAMCDVGTLASGATATMTINVTVK